MENWDSELYARFLKERTQPAIDLVSRIELERPDSIVDAGCGPGNSTLVLQRRWPNAAVSAFDNSRNMLAKARGQSAEIDWFLADLDTWVPQESVDLIFSNAVLHWLPNHDLLIPRLLSHLRIGGRLAVQQPAHYRSMIHEMLEAVADRPAWQSYTRDARSGILRHTATDYYDLLKPLVASVDIWETEYFHTLNDACAILDWFRGTGLRPILDSLPNDEARQDFEAELLACFKQAFKPRGDGNVILPFPRLFFIAGS